MWCKPLKKPPISLLNFLIAFVVVGKLITGCTCVQVVLCMSPWIIYDEFPLILCILSSVQRVRQLLICITPDRGGYKQYRNIKISSAVYPEGIYVCWKIALLDFTWLEMYAVKKSISPEFLGISARISEIQGLWDLETGGRRGTGVG